MTTIAGNKIGNPLTLTEAPGSGATITVRTFDVPGSGQPGQQPYGWLYLGLVSSHDSAAAGLTAEASWDGGANWTVVATDAYAAADGFTLFKAPLVAPTMRWRYVNSANVLTVWRGQAFWSQLDLVP